MTNVLKKRFRGFLPIVIDVETAGFNTNGKTRGTIEINRDEEGERIFENIIKNKYFDKYFENSNVKRKIYVPNKIINILTS